MSSASSIDFFGNYCNTVDGVLIGSEQSSHGTNPANEEKLPPVPVATSQDIERAMQSAQAAFKKWSTVPWAERRAAILKFADSVEAHANELAELLTREQGKPLSHALGEVQGSSTWMRAWAQKELVDEVVRDDSKKIIVRYTPLGVAVGIVPWNFPVIQVLLKITPAVLTGNTIIIKPSPFTPYCALKIGELAQRFFPSGVVQVLNGGDDLGPTLTNHPIPAKIAFTGSTETGKRVMESASKTLKRVTLELGGNDPAIVLPDVDVPQVASELVTKCFLNAGQICLAVKRVYVHETIYEHFKEVFVAHAQRLQTGEGFAKDSFVGPIQNDMQFKKAIGLLEDARSTECKFSLGGTVRNGSGYFIEPAVIDRPDEKSRVVQEEAFAPIVPLLSWKDESDVLQRANDTRWGLGASVWTRDMVVADRMARQIEAGSVWINSHFDQDPDTPTGGHKESGIGVESSLEGLKSFCNIQALYFNK